MVRTRGLIDRLNVVVTGTLLHHAARVAGLRVKRTRLTATTQDPRAIAVVERVECVGRRADLRLIAVDDGRDDEKTTNWMPLSPLGFVRMPMGLGAEAMCRDSEGRRITRWDRPILRYRFRPRGPRSAVR
jgi:hypothetical protein